jgi:MraZ protein
VDRKLRFIGESHHKVDGKGRVSIPAPFRRVLVSGDPDCAEGGNPQLVIVYGGEARNFLECFTVDAIEKIYDKIEKMPRASKKRKALQRLYSTHALYTAVDDTGRLVLPAKLREKIGLSDQAFFASQGETFEIWKPETYDEVYGVDEEAEEDFDPDLDASHYLDGDMEE